MLGSCLLFLSERRHTCWISFIALRPRPTEKACVYRFCVSRCRRRHTYNSAPFLFNELRLLCDEVKVAWRERRVYILDNRRSRESMWLRFSGFGEQTFDRLLESETIRGEPSEAQGHAWHVQPFWNMRCHRSYFVMRKETCGVWWRLYRGEDVWCWMSCFEKERTCQLVAFREEKKETWRCRWMLLGGAHMTAWRTGFGTPALLSFRHRVRGSCLGGAESATLGVRDHDFWIRTGTHGRVLAIFGSQRSGLVRRSDRWAKGTTFIVMRPLLARTCKEIVTCLRTGRHGKTYNMLVCISVATKFDGEEGRHWTPQRGMKKCSEFDSSASGQETIAYQLTVFSAVWQCKSWIWRLTCNSLCPPKHEL